MTQLKTAFCFIAKDKADILDRLLNSTKKVFDLYCMADTGSSDDTIKVFINWCKLNNKEYLFDKGQLTDNPKKNNDYRFTVINNKRTLADFGKAREVSFDLARKKGMDFVFWSDTDDVIINAENIPLLVEKMNSNKIQLGLVNYIYAKVSKNSPKPIIQKREKLIDLRIPGHWIGRVHENYTIEGATTAPINDISVEHERTPYEAMETERRNHQIMEEEVKELGIEKIDEKMLNDLAYDHWEWKEYDKAIEYYKILLERNIQNPELKFGILIKIATAYIGKNQLEDALIYANKALLFAPLHPDSSVIMAELYADMNQFEEANFFADKILKLGKPQTTNPINEMDYSILPMRIKAEFALRQGRLDDAINILKDIYKIFPNDEFRQNIANIEKEKLKKNAINSIHNMLLYFQNNNKFENIGNLISSIPKDLREDINVRNLIKEGKNDYKRKTSNIKFNGSKSIVFYAGGFFEQWDGESDIKKGIGGSEGMCISMARELAKLGNKVFVYNETIEEHIVDGVTYINHQKWNSRIKCDVFISLRRPDVFSQIISAKKQYLWLHDTYYGEVPMINLYSPDKVIVLSEAHKDIIQKGYGLEDDVFWKSRNSINPRAIPSEIPERNPYQLIYASSYDRGLDNLLSLWPKIKASVPQATLKIFYGWNTYDMLMNQRQSQEMMDYKQKILKMISETEGVTELGRISQTELYKQFAESSIWCYPTEFYEIFCINGATAQAMGCVPVCTPMAALNEIVNNKYGFKTDINNIADEVIYLLKHQKELDKRREPMMKWARDQFSAEKLAQEWDLHFNQY